MWPDDRNWQMTLLLVLAIALLGFIMKLIALLLPQGNSTEGWALFWPLPSPASLKRLRPVTNSRPVVLRALLLLTTLVVSYWVYWRVVSAFHLRGFLLGYLAAPILLLTAQTLIALLALLWLPSGRLFPALLNRPVLAQSVSDFWGRRWNLWFRDWFRHEIFNRLRHRPLFALFLVFAISGLMHEWVINVPLYYVTYEIWFGSMMIYFLLQPFGMLFERRFLIGHPYLMRAFAWLIILGPSPLILNPGLLRALHLWPLNG